MFFFIILPFTLLTHTVKWPVSEILTITTNNIIDYTNSNCVKVSDKVN